MLAKKVLLFIPALLMTSPLLFSCSKQDPNVTYLKVLNSEDYIADGLIEEFEQQQSVNGKKVKVIYETFDTMENMYNTLKTGKTKYDLVCASDYMVQKLVNLDLLSPIDFDSVNNYANHADYIRGRLKAIQWGGEDGKKYNLDQYSVCYMWGTLGLLYNPEFSLIKARDIKVDEVHNDMKAYDSLWFPKYQKVASIKDSMRDTYAIGLIHSFKDELKAVEDDEEARQIIFDYGGENDGKANKHINTIKNDLIKLRDNIFGFEVDSGKEDIVTEKIGIDTAWSGDAVRAISNADEEKGLKLYYSVPEEGSNLWFDCWTIQKGANVDLANKFLNFLSDSSNAIKNMQAIGYTSSIANESTFNYFNEIYGGGSGDSFDLSYFFGDGKEIKIKDDLSARKIAAQFPRSDEEKKLMVMKDYGKNNDLVLKMWEEVKHEPLPVWAIALFVVEIAIIATAITIVITLRIRNKNRRKERKIRAA